MRTRYIDKGWQHLSVFHDTGADELWNFKDTDAIRILPILLILRAIVDGGIGHHAVGGSQINSDNINGFGQIITPIVTIT